VTWVVVFDINATKTRCGTSRVLGMSPEERVQVIGGEFRFDEVSLGGSRGSRSDRSPTPQHLMEAGGVGGAAESA
jgi:hypothetical protein